MHLIYSYIARLEVTMDQSETTSLLCRYIYIVLTGDFLKVLIEDLSVPLRIIFLCN